MANPETNKKKILVLISKTRSRLYNDNQLVVPTWGKPRRNSKQRNHLLGTSEDRERLKRATDRVVGA